MGSNTISFGTLASAGLQAPVETKAPQAKKEEERSSSKSSSGASSSGPTFQIDSRAVVFEIDPKSGDTYISVVDPETGEVVRQIPPKELREMAERLAQVTGNIFDSVG